MTQAAADSTKWQVIGQIADQDTTRSLGRTINAAILLRAMRDPATPAKPRKTSHAMAFLGLAEFFVGQHEGLLRIFIQHWPF